MNMVDRKAQRTLIHRTRREGREGAWVETSLYRHDHGFCLVQHEQYSNTDEEEPVNEIYLSEEEGRQFGLAMSE